MSLNGLDTPAVVEAYQSALVDAGGWFLLHYIARDEVALFDRGTGGVPEVRNAIDNFEESSPLYGFLQYRRRKVILRYMPEGLSRLILARSNVQFQSILDKFNPHDTVLPLSQATDLNESALSSACLLHTASGSITSSSSSLRRRRLMEITEDAEENGVKEETKDKAQPSQAPPPTKSEARDRSGSLKSEATVVPPTPSLPSPEVEKEKASLGMPSPPSRASSRPPPSRGSPSETHSETMSPTPASPASSSGRSRYRNILDEFPRPSDEARMSTQSARPSLRDLERASTYSSSTYSTTPKVKLGPRPSLDQAGRPRTSGSSKNSEQRPVASLPSNMRSSSVRKSTVIEPPRPRSQGSSFATRPNSRAPPIPPLLVPPPSIPISKPQLSPGAKSLGALSTSSGMTPEKERLMKALQQRRKAMAKRAEDAKKKSTLAEIDESKPSPEPEPTRNPEENKENVRPDPVVEKPQPEEPPREEKPVEPVPIPSPPAPERAPPQVPVEQVEEEILAPVAFEEPKAEISTDNTVSDSDGCPSSHTSRPSAETTFSIDHGENLETIKAETPQTPLEDETRAEPEDSAIPDLVETKESLVPPSASVEIPLEPESTEIPEVPEQSFKLPDTPSPTAEIPPAVAEQLEVSVVNPTHQVAPESVSIPDATPVVSPPTSGSEPTVAPVSVSIDPVPSEEIAPEELKVTKPGSLLPLDQRRKIHLEPIQVPTQDYSDDDNLLSDDSFMEELRSATVQEARPVAVNSPNGGQHWRSPSRAVSSPNGLPSPSVSQTLAMGRSASSSHADNGPPTPVLMVKKVNVSSGISSRIKALEKFSTTPTVATHNVPAPSNSSSFESLRKRASVSYPGDITLPDFSRAPSVNLHDSHPNPNMARRTSSISVTAHIVRDTHTSASSPDVEPSDSTASTLQASPLTVDHGPTEEPVAQSPAQSPAVESPNRLEDRSMSISSIGSNRQTPASRPTSRLSLSSRSRTDENMQATSPSEDKKESRASRLMRRMSSMTTSSRRSIIGALSSPVKEEESSSAILSDSISPSPSRQNLVKPIEIGEVNVQFPDTLLWKRRCMRIDENGYLVLGPATNDSTARNMIKRYHLTEFRTPCLPDEDMQELPNSILLDLFDGSTLQCACESRQGQASVLQTLIEAHAANQS